MVQRLFLALAAWCMTACYYYQPLTTPEPASGVYLLATLNDLGTDTLSRTIGPDVRSIRGRLLDSDSAALRLSVTGVTLYHGENVTWRGEALMLRRSYVASLEQRRVAKGQTALIVGATVLAVVTSYKVFQGVGLIPTNTSGPPPPK